ncbi:MAG: hypothetical protein A2161_22290 [Candidatus Schekmanbacteria bacterium RBG_13_48_7]|uniref:Solute-binding protein family 5 domain-containing protein n=1 Tax=Candidatus Schekmanbacteria bacterium RBG_13_48_7 TaxID=1817878 RepID=A0A1F7RYP2_9BACT|nr:MAG: hypothetical protein A2161_22290 [Candidatus Schekmanbacteria bacterium RBG_13_48_7]
METKYKLNIFFVIFTCIIMCHCDKIKEKSATVGPTKVPGTSVQIDSSPAEGGIIAIALEGEPVTLNPVLLTDINSHTLCILIFDGLVSHDAELNYVPRLAKSWDVSDDKLSITFHLHENVKWHDGQPFTSEDVKFTFKTIMNTEILARSKADLFDLVEHVETPDPYTFKVFYKKPFAPCFESWETLVIPKHIYGFNKSSEFIDSSANFKPVGTGPFKFKEAIPGESITLERNFEYFGGKPYLEKVNFTYVKSKEEALNLALNKIVNIAPMDPTQWQLFSGSVDFGKKFSTMKIFQLAYDYIAWNMDGSNPFFNDKNVRIAMSHCLDKKQIIDRILYDLGKPLTGPFMPDSWAYNPDITPYPFDLDTAKKLLADAGWSQTNDEGTLTKQGIPFEFSILVRDDQEVRIRISELLKSNLQKIGIKMRVVPLPFKEWLNRIIETKKFEAAIGGWNMSIDPDPYNTWYSGNYKNGLNFVKFMNTRADQLMEDGRITFDQKQRQKLYWEFHNVIHEEQPYTFLFVKAFMYACDKRIHNIKSCPKGLLDQYPGIETWYIPRQLQ